LSRRNEPVKKTLRIVAAVLMVGSVAFWVAAGANHGWTKTRVPTQVMDSVTGLEGIEWHDKFVPGVDFLAAALLGAGLLAGVSFLVRTKSK